MSSAHKDILRRTVDALEASLRRYPDNDKILLQLALAYSQIGRFDPAAQDAYQRASERFPSDVKLQRALSIGFLVSQTGQLLRETVRPQDVDQASLQQNIDKLGKLTREFPDSPHLHKALGDLQLLRGDEKEAIQHYRACMALGIEDLEELARNYEVARRLRPYSSRIGSFFAELYQRTGRDEMAAQIYQEYMAKPSPDPALLERYTEFLQHRIDDAVARDPDLALGPIRDMVRVCLVRGSLKDALHWAHQVSPFALGQEPKLVRELGRRLIAVEDFRAAFEFLSKIPVDQESKDLLDEMAMMLERKGEIDSAAYVLQFINNNDEFARQHREAKPQKVELENHLLEVEAERQMAEIHWKNRRWQQALDCYLHVLSMGLDDHRSILEPLDALLAKIVDVPSEQLSFLANYFLEKRDYRRCRRFALQFLEHDPSSHSMSQRLLQSCEKILAEDREDHDTRLAYGDEFLRIGNIERALQEFRRCAEVPEYKIKATRRLALASFRAGDLVGALDRYRNLMILETEDLERLYDLSMALSVAEQYKEAFEAMKLIREFEPGFRDAEVRYAELEEKVRQNNFGFVIDPRMRELIGDHSIGRYKYVGRIGSGGMGVVHKVVDLKTNAVVAMKILREGLSSSGKAIDRFFREARIAATLRHRNIVNILDYNISNNHGQSYIAMEFVDGPTLRELVERKFSNTVDISTEDILEALDWISQLCDALDATHKKGIIHRDIKPDNVMLAPGGVIKITDFGIVHIEEATFTPTGALIGTPRYMSPEQVHGGRIDARSDIYAVGIILYEVLIGSPPYISGDIAYQQVNVMPTSPKEICPVIPASVDRIIMRCLEKSAAERYQSTLELKQDVDEAFMRLGGDPRRRRPDAAAAAPNAAAVELMKPALLGTPAPLSRKAPQVPAPAAAHAPRHASPSPGQAPLPSAPPGSHSGKSTAPRTGSRPAAGGEESIETPVSFLHVQKPNETRAAEHRIHLDSEFDV